jgi:hypothetical protein
MNRQIPEEVVIETLFGPAIATKFCNTCKNEKYIHEFYCESKSKRSNEEEVAEQSDFQTIYENVAK